MALPESEGDQPWRPVAACGQPAVWGRCPPRQQRLHPPAWEATLLRTAPASLAACWVARTRESGLAHRGSQGPARFRAPKVELARPAGEKRGPPARIRWQQELPRRECSVLVSAASGKVVGYPSLAPLT